MWLAGKTVSEMTYFNVEWHVTYAPVFIFFDVHILYIVCRLVAESHWGGGEEPSDHCQWVHEPGAAVECVRDKPSCSAWPVRATQPRSWRISCNNPTARFVCCIVKGERLGRVALLYFVSCIDLILYSLFTLNLTFVVAVSFATLTPLSGDFILLQFFCDVQHNVGQCV